ncbi:MAG: RNA 2',3'-cyclic phosphodiesterase [Planctomycetota bacterium]|jgi:2'-5' RNA ligase
MRCFLAIEPSQDLRAILGDCIARLSTGFQGIRWVPVENIHLTCKFLGDLNREDLESLVELLQEADLQTKLDLGVGRLGCFPSRGGLRVIWAGVTGDTEALQLLAEQLEEAAELVGVPSENRPFRAHWTLGRARRGRALPGSEDLRRQLEELAENWQYAPARQAGLRLFESELGAGPPRYRIRASF